MTTGTTHAVGVMVDLAQRLMSGRRIVAVAGPGDCRDERTRARSRPRSPAGSTIIARRDDGLRGARRRRGAAITLALQVGGVAEDEISIIPDEQQAVDAALKHGRVRRATLCSCSPTR